VLPAVTRFWFAQWEAAANAAVTVSQRMGVMETAALRGRLMTEPEIWRMTSEKMVAAAEGAVAAGFAAATEMPRVAMNPARLPAASLAIAEAALAPARRKVRSNAKRLSRAKSR
jgi:hypothetical protein